MKKSNRIGPKMYAVLSLVTAEPGRAMVHYARQVGPNGSLKYGYRTIHRAIMAGLVTRYGGPRNSYLLFPTIAQ